MAPSTLRSWEDRYGWPKSSRTRGKHRRYDALTIHKLAQVMQNGHVGIVSAMEQTRSVAAVVTTCPHCGEELETVNVKFIRAN